jgi:hypothetical protein
VVTIQSVQAESRVRAHMINHKGGQVDVRVRARVNYHKRVKVERRGNNRCD